MILKIVSDHMYLIQLVRDKVRFRNFIRTVMKLRGFVEGEAFLDGLWMSASQEEFFSVELVI